MVGNFKILLIFSCKNDKEIKEQIAVDVINQNFSILMDSVSFYELPNSIGNDAANKVVYLDRQIIAMDANNSEERTREKFNLKEHVEPIFFNINKIPLNTVKGYKVKLASNTSKIDNYTTINLANIFVDKSHKLCSITVVSKKGIGAKFEIYYFKQLNGLWTFAGKEILALG